MTTNKTEDVAERWLRENDPEYEQRRHDWGSGPKRPSEPAPEEVQKEEEEGNGQHD